MFRYYVSINYRLPNGLGFQAADITVPKRITCAKDVAEIRDYFARQGYTNPVVLGFSLYSEPTAEKSNS